jgi:hypothetical protein
MPGLDPAIQEPAPNLDGRVTPTAVRFNLVDVVHGIDSTGIQAFCDGLDTDEDQRHAA